MEWSIALTDTAALRVQGLFLAEGRLVLDRILAGAAGGPDAIVSVLATPPAVRALRLDERLSDRLTIRTPAEMEVLTGFNFHRGVLALVRRPALVDVTHVIEAGLGCPAPGTPYPVPATPVPGTPVPGIPVPGAPVPGVPVPGARHLVVVVLEHLVDVDNVGSCFRNARALGAAGVLLDARCPDPLYRKAIRTSLGAVLEVPWAQGPMDAIVEALSARGVVSIGLTPQGGGGMAGPARILRELHVHLEPSRPLALVVGNEGSGLSAGTLAGCTHLARIPMADGADSINVATALAVALYELTRS